MKAEPNWLIPLKQGFLTWGAEINLGGAGEGHTCGGKS